MPLLDFKDIKAIFRRNRGAASKLARELGVTPQAVYAAINGFGTKRITEAVLIRAKQLLDEEKEHD